MSGLKTASRIYKPFRYPWAYEAWKIQQRSHWIADEVPLGSDVKDWNTKLSDAEKNLITQIFRFFTQSDIEVNNCYMTEYSQVFKPVEVNMMLSAFSNIETVHIDAYSQLLDTIGMPEVEYSAFKEYKEMVDKYDHMSEFSCKNDFSTAETLAMFGAFTEGLQLFASFAILLNFPRFNKLKGMGQIIKWSVRDESLHCENVIRLYHTFLEENPMINVDKLHEKLYNHLLQVIKHEDAFIDLAFEMGDIEGLTAEEVKQYIRYIANIRLRQLGIEQVPFDIHTNPLPWLDDMLNSVSFTNFFENKSTEYSKAATQGDWDDAY